MINKLACEEYDLAEHRPSIERLWCSYSEFFPTALNRNPEANLSQVHSTEHHEEILRQQEVGDLINAQMEHH